jgi:glycosyltransferase involved in cell wall biosynthesis
MGGYDVSSDMEVNRFARTIVTLLGIPAVPLVCAFAWMRGRLSRRFAGAERVALLYSQVMWDEVWQRPQEFASRLAGGVPVLYVAPVQVHDWLLSLRGRYSPVRVLPELPGLVVLSPLILPGHYKNRVVFDLNCRITALILRAWLPPESPVHCDINTPFGFPVIARLFLPRGIRSARLARLVYDVIDDFVAFDWAPAFGKDLEIRLLASADTVITGTHELLEKHQESHPDTEFIPCGVDFDLFHSQDGLEPPDLHAVPHPIIGYFGSVSDRIDFDLVAVLARAMPHASVVLVGPVRMPAHLLPRAPNINYLGLKPHGELPRYARRFSVALIPFLVNDATVKLNPVKTLEYLAAGVPVVSTAIPDVARFFSDAVHVARSHDEFIELVRAAADAPDAGRIAAGIAMAKRASWEEMARRMHDKLFSAPPAGAGVIPTVREGN